jgi:hypothetical protein
MKRRLAQMDGNGSLDLLLDTLCNVFGGIVLIACLLAILPRHKSPPPLLPTHVAGSQMIERRMASAQIEIERMEAEIERLSSKTNPALAELQSRRASLEKLRDKLQNDKSTQEKMEVNEAEAHAITETGDIEALQNTLNQLRFKNSQAEELDTASKEKIAFLEERSKQLADELSDITKGRTQAVRFPRERDAKKDPFPIILRYNSVYPLEIGNAGRGNPAIQKIPVHGGEAFQAKPLPGKGIINPMEDKQLDDTLKAAIRGDMYVSLYLYPDSHEVFADLRDTLSRAGIRYGLEFVEQTRDLAFSSSGTAPPEL